MAKKLSKWLIFGYGIIGFCLLCLVILTIVAGKYGWKTIIAFGITWIFALAMWLALVTGEADQDSSIPFAVILFCATIVIYGVSHLFIGIAFGILWGMISMVGWTIKFN
jgi:hypothetical protein